MSKISLRECIGQGYDDFWNFKGRYRVVKGSRASKKSKTTALWFVIKLFEYPDANLLVVRKTYRSLKDSCFVELKWAINKLGLNAYFKIKESPIEITKIDTGQKIYFRGLDDPMKLTSIAVVSGHLCWYWIEEAYEIRRESDFDMLNESFRGEVPDGLFKQATITFNPWDAQHWLKRRFFDVSDKDILAKTTNYKCNEWLDAADLKLFEDMKNKNPERYKVAGLGDWGETGGLIITNYDIKDFEVKQYRFDAMAFGQDFGFNHANAILLLGWKDGNVYVCDELYVHEKDTGEIIQAANEKFGNFKNYWMWCDSAEPDRIKTWTKSGWRAFPVKKGANSVSGQIDWLKNHDIIINPKCVNLINELQQWRWMKNRISGEFTDQPTNELDDAIAALRYGVESWRQGAKAKAYGRK